MDDYIFDEFINGATANHQDPHFRTEPTRMVDEDGVPIGISVICKLGDRCAKHIVSRDEIILINVSARDFGSEIRRMLWEQITKEQ